MQEKIERTTLEKLPTDRYTIQSYIDSGTYGAVYVANDTQSDQLVAIKEIVMTKVPEYRRDHLIKLIREIQLMYKLSIAKCNQFTVKLLDIYTNSEAQTDPSKLTHVFLVMEYIGTSLHMVINSACPLEVNQAKVLMYNLVLALKFLHSANVMHRDLKPANILINEDCTVKLCDFGLSRCLYQPVKQSKTKKKVPRPLTPVCSTRYYRAPEIILQQGHYDGTADMWSFGCVVSELSKKTMAKHSGNRYLFKGKTCYPISPQFTEQ